MGIYLGYLPTKNYIDFYSRSKIYDHTDEKFCLGWSNSIDVAIATLLSLLLLKKVGSARLRESGIHPISPKTPATQYQPIDKNERKGKKVEDYSRDRAA